MIKPGLGSSTVVFMPGDHAFVFREDRFGAGIPMRLMCGYHGKVSWKVLLGKITKPALLKRAVY
jgi:hypothetical protein